DGNQGGVVDRGSQDLLLFKVLRHEDDRLDASTGSGRCYCVGEVAGRGTGQHLESQLARRRQGNGDNPVFEGVRWIARVVFDPELFQTKIIRKIAGIDQPGEAGVGRAEGSDVGWDRQQRGISPDAPRARLDPAPGNGRKLVTDLERTEAVGTDVVGAELRNSPALATDEVCGIPECAG